MTNVLRKSKRHGRFLPISILAMEESDNSIMAGPLPGKIINVSRHGACLLMSQVMINSYHIFHSTRERNSSYLQLTINVHPEVINCTIPSRPIWMDIFKEGDIRAFKIGVEFLNNPEGAKIKHLEQAIKKK